MGRRSGRESRAVIKSCRRIVLARSASWKICARLVGLSFLIVAEEQSLCIAENTRERVAEFMRDTGEHLTERGEFFGLQQLGLEDALGCEIAIDFDAAEALAFGAHDGAAGTLQDARHRAQELDLVAHAASSAPRASSRQRFANFSGSAA